MNAEFQQKRTNNLLPTLMETPINPILHTCIDYGSIQIFCQYGLANKH